MNSNGKYEFVFDGKGKHVKFIKSEKPEEKMQVNGLKWKYD